ncbi:MAG: class II fructose-bisphosphate aldolase [Anaerolineae bacterium]
MPTTAEIVARARVAGRVVLAFNVPYLPMLEPIVRAVADEGAFALIETARLEWLKFESGGPAAVMAEYGRHALPAHVHIHLDHVPVVDEEGSQVDYLSVIGEAIGLGYQSVMVDGSRLSLEDNIAATRRVADMAHRAGIACEAELGAVLGHEAGPLPDYEELFRSGRGFTDVAEAERFARESGCDWLSVAVGNIHGAVSGALRSQKKVCARLDRPRVVALGRATGLPLVLHGGSGIRQEDASAAVTRGIAKVNVASEIRQAYEAAVRAGSTEATARAAAYERTRAVIQGYGRLVARRLGDGST